MLATPSVNSQMRKAAPTKSAEAPKSPAAQAMNLPSDRAFQLREMMPVAVFAGLLVFLAVALVLAPLHWQLANDPDPEVQALLNSQLLQLELRLAPLLVVSAAVGAGLAVVRARRIARPVQQVRSALSKLAVQTTETFAVRPGDEFSDLEPAFAALTARVSQLTKGKAELLYLLRRNLEGLAQRAATQQLSGEQLQESLAAMLRDVETEIKKLPPKE